MLSPFDTLRVSEKLEEYILQDRSCNFGRQLEAADFNSQTISLLTSSNANYRFAKKDATSLEAMRSSVPSFMRLSITVSLFSSSRPMIAV